ncbi:Membrane protein-like protein protein [uncultured Eubacteriales bacterium]|uniref:Riboflavin transporter n=1 Tax=uncultured Eubacteriales bacterium TaxID=172733 RepID=A0A212K7A4_9FIRM|nr:Membrane protein-like protein protein [uncultured Eubacteriales bacterium]
MSEQSASLPRKRSKVFTTNYMVKVAVMAAVARVVMLLEFPLPIFPSFLKLDFSDLVPLIGSLAMGPLAGVLIELVKCLIHVINTTTGGVGDLANFVVGAVYVWSVGFFYQRHKTKGGAVLGLAVGTLAMIIAGAVVNYFITIPLYGLVMGWSEEMIVGMGSAILPAIQDKFTLILFAFCPFNLLKGVILTLLALPLYKRFSPLLHKGLI